MRRLLIGLLVQAVILLPDLGTARPAFGSEEVREIAPGVVYRAVTRFDPVLGAQELRILRFRIGGPVSLRPVLARDHGQSRERVSDLTLASGALAAVNGNFFTASGNVRGIHILDGVMHSEAEPPMPGAPTSRAAWRVEGNTIQLGRPGTNIGLERNGDRFGVNGINRALGYLGNPDEGVLQTSGFGETTTTPVEGADVVLDQLDSLTPEARLAATVDRVRSGGGTIPEGGAVLSTTGANAAQARALDEGDEVEVVIETDDPGFEEATFAGGGGPWIVHDGQPIAMAGMLGEGFSPLHISARAPRTAIGRTGGGEILLVTVDGRQPGRSLGASLDVLAQIMIELGASEAMSLDGGGSTTMAVDGLVMNVPSGEDTGGRIGREAAVADAVGVFFDFQPQASERVAGTDRVATAIELAQDWEQSDDVVLATSAGFADALVGGPLAAHLGAPVLLTPPSGLTGPIVEELARLGAHRVFVLGGPAALGPQIEIDLSLRGIGSTRLAGADRYETAAAVARTLPPSDTVLIASGVAFPDALAAGTLGLPVLLTGPNQLPAATRQSIGSSKPVVVGGPAAVGDVVPGAERIAGPDRFATSAAVIDWGLPRNRYAGADVLLAARGDDYPDALVGGALRRPLLLVGRFGLGHSPSSRDWLARVGPAFTTARLLGGRPALSTMTHLEIDGIVAQPVAETAVSLPLPDLPLPPPGG